MNSSKCSKQAWGNRGHAHDALGQYKKAIDDLTQVINLDPADSIAYGLRAKAKAFEHSHEYQKAIRDLSEPIRLNPLDAQAHARRAELYKKIGNNEWARLDRETAKKLDHP